MSEDEADAAPDGVEEGKRLIRVGGTSGLSLADRLSERFHRLTWRTPLHTMRLKGRYPLKLIAVPDDPVLGNAARGAALLEGRIAFRGESHELDALDFRRRDWGKAFANHVHGFAWLRDLSTVATRAQGAPIAEALTARWLHHYAEKVDALAWAPDLWGRRMLLWTAHAPLILSSTDLVYRSSVLNTLARGARHLDRGADKAPVGSPRIAAWCGVVGLKPSFGRVPQWPLGAQVSVAVAGPLARTVRDAALMLSALARADQRDPYCIPDDPRDWRDGIEDGVAGLRIGVLHHPGFDAPADPDSIAAVEQAAQILADQGAEIETAAPDLPDTSVLFTQLWSTALALVVAETPPDQRPLLDAGLREIAARDSIPATDLFRAIALQNRAAHTMARLHRRYDLVLCPSVPAPPPLADSPLVDPAGQLVTAWAPWTFLFNMTRQPAISIPLGIGRDNLPRSVQFAAAQYRDDLVLRAARAVERAIERAQGETA